MVHSNLSKPRFSGILMHISSLPNGGMCGTFGEPSRKWISLLSLNEISVWQFLPLTPTDCSGSPYSSPSSFAFNPWFLDANDLVEEGFISINAFDELSKTLSTNNNSKLDFRLENLRINNLAKALRKEWINQSKERQLEFDKWRLDQFWLEDYACFMELRRQYNGLPWWEWPEKFSKYNIKELANWKSKYKDFLLEQMLLQWHLNRQWKALREIAQANGILLFGDLPFYVSRDSADAWSNRELFSIFPGGGLLNQSGVPPDYFSETGQLWGTPVYRWQKHKNTSYKWWRSRLRHQWLQVDLLRLDHFRAMDSYWAVPGAHLTAQKGCWLPSPGLEILTILMNDYGSSLPLVAEDLGVITPEVDCLRSYFDFPGMKILQFGFDGNLNNPYLPENIKGYKWIVYTGTHDNDTTNGWWSEQGDESKDMVCQRYTGNYQSPAWKLIELGMNTDSILFVSPLQDILSLGTEARLNKPGTIKDNWNWMLCNFHNDLLLALKNYGELTKLCGRSFKEVHKIFKEY